MKIGEETDYGLFKFVGCLFATIDKRIHNRSEKFNVKYICLFACLLLLLLRRIPNFSGSRFPVHKFGINLAENSLQLDVVQGLVIEGDGQEQGREDDDAQGDVNDGHHRLGIHKLYRCL